jgi:methionyl-tRNA formyltransferase
MNAGKKSLNIIFYGTPGFAIPSLDVLINNGFDISAVVTTPDKPAGRGLQLKKSEIKIFAEEKGLYILQPENLNDPDFIDQIQSLKPDLQVVVAFRKLPEIVWNMPPLGTINVHASLLPQYRGAAPINWVIINGEKETGVTTFFISHKIDTGDIIMNQKVQINDDDTAGSLHDKLSFIGADLLLATVISIEKEDCPRIKQDLFTELKRAPKINSLDCRIDWHNNIDTVCNFIRGLSPYPTAWTALNGKKLKIFSAQKIIENANLKPGTVLTDNKTYFKVVLNQGCLSLTELQLEGRKRLFIKEFLIGLNKNESLILE